MYGLSKEQHNLIQLIQGGLLERSEKGAISDLMVYCKLTKKEAKELLKNLKN